METTTYVFDTECYPNVWLALFKNLATGDVQRFELSERSKLDVKGLATLLNSGLLVGFNSIRYDAPMIQLALRGWSTQKLYESSCAIIGGADRHLYQTFGLNRPTWDHVDLIAVAPLTASLKVYGGRLHVAKLQELPFDPHQPVAAENLDKLVAYCANDLAVTEALYAELQPQVELRTAMSHQYGMDLRSKSDAQVAEAIISSEIGAINGFRPSPPDNVNPGRVYAYRIPDYLRFTTPSLCKLLDDIRVAPFTVDESGYINMPPALKDREVKVNGTSYRLGIGGLHSCEAQASHEADSDTLLLDRDVASYYPSIILTQRLFPQHLGEAFLTVYQSLVTRRLAAKAAGDKSTAESLKIAVNGSFGKLGSQYSCLYAPDLLIQVTLTGQLLLLKLIEILTADRFRVLSANTDGVLIKCPRERYETLCGHMSYWETLTGMVTEETSYTSVWAKDVNNYLAIKTDGSVKGKGLYANPWSKAGRNVAKLQKNPCTTVVLDAVAAFLRSGMPVELTIKACTDVTKFVALRVVKGGATSGGEDIGKVVRWFYAKDDTGSMGYKKSRKKVPKSDGAKPLLDLPSDGGLPADLNYDWYVQEARAVLHAVGYTQMTLFGS